MNKEKAVERAKKLMAMAADVSSPNEAAIAARRARSIIDQYQLESCDLADKSEFSAQVASKARSRVPRWEQTLCVAVANLNDCIAIFNNSRCIVFKGFDEDAEVCKFMFFYLVENGKRCCKNYIRETPRGCRYSFKHKYALTVCEKIILIMETRKTELKTSSGQSLVLVKKNLVENEFGAADYDEHKSYKQLDRESELAGYIAGQRTNIVTGIRTDERIAIPTT